MTSTIHGFEGKTSKPKGTGKNTETLVAAAQVTHSLIYKARPPGGWDGAYAFAFEQ